MTNKKTDTPDKENKEPQVATPTPKPVKKSKPKTTSKPKKKTVKKATSKPKETPKVETQVPEPKSQAEVYELMDRADEEQILTEIGGRGAEVADELVYSFKGSDGKEVTGLTWVGTKMASYYMRQKKLLNISDVDVTYDKDPDDESAYLFKATVEDLITKARSLGFKRQSKKTLVNDWKNGKVVGKKEVDNTFWFETGASKARRNAMQSLMPADWIAKQITQWLKEGKVKVLGGAGQKTSTLDSNSLTRISPILNRINKIGVVEDLDEAKKFVMSHKNLNGQEKNHLLKAIEAKSKTFK